MNDKVQIIEEQTGEVIMAPFIRTPYNYNRDEASMEAGTSCPEPTLTQQQFKDEADINTLVQRFGLTGQLPAEVRTPMAEDFVAITTYHEALNTVREAEAAFMEMPAHIRAHFKNDAGAFLAFTEDESNRGKAEELGLVMKRPGVVGKPTEETPQKE